MRLVSFNLLHGRSLSDGRVDAGRIQAAIGSLDADIVGLQEVDHNQPRSGCLDLTALAAEVLDAPHARFAAALVGTPGEDWVPATGEGVAPATGEGRVPAAAEASTRPRDRQTDAHDLTVSPAYGVALISRLPVTSWHIARFRGAPVRSPVLVPGTRQAIWVRDEPRVLLAAVVETPAGGITVATTHLSFVPGWNLLQLRRAVAALRTLPGPRILLGDLNLPAGLPQFTSGWRSLAAVKTYPKDRPKVQLDHALADGPLPSVRLARADPLAISDHRALIVELADDPGAPRAPT